MSPGGAYVLAVAAFIALGALGAWMINIPWWAIGVLAVAGIGLARWLFRRTLRKRARQETET
jgi:hypothetical protein